MENRVLNFFKSYFKLSIRLHKLEKCVYQRALLKSSLFKVSAQIFIDNFIVTSNFT